MSFVHRLVATVMLALWLPAVLHCDLEAAGMTVVFTCDEEAHDTSRDGCNTVEEAPVKPVTNSAKLPQLSLWPALVSFLIPTPALLPPPPVEGVPEDGVAPLEIVRTWRFIVRAAPPSRAPSLAS